MKLSIRTITGKTIVVFVEGDQTVGILKERIKEKEGIPVRQQRLIVAGKVLEDDRTIWLDYNLS